MILQNDTTSDTMNGSKQRVELIDYGVAKSTKSLLHEDEYLECEGPFGTKGKFATSLTGLFFSIITIPLTALSLDCFNMFYADSFLSIHCRIIQIHQH